MEHKELEVLRKNVHENPDAQRSGVELIMGIAALVDQAADDDEMMLEELLVALKDGATELAVAVVANTPRTALAAPGGAKDALASAAPEPPGVVQTDTSAESTGGVPTPNS